MKNDSAKQEEPAANAIRIVGNQRLLDRGDRYLASFSNDGFFISAFSRLAPNECSMLKRGAVGQVSSLPGQRKLASKHKHKRSASELMWAKMPV